MKALLSYEPGDASTLRLADTAAPHPGDHEVLVDVRAVGVNYPDALRIEDKYQDRPPRPFAPGAEFAGVVAARGASIGHVNVGDRVLGLCRFGAMAEQVVVDQHSVQRIPAAVPFDVAAALMVTYGTSLYALRERAALAAGETVLVLGAGGGVGLAAVELSRALGARVVAAVSDERKAQAARDAGAHDTVIYPRGPLDRAAQKLLADQFKAACGMQGANVVYDAVGGTYAEPALRSIAWEGRYLVIGFPAGIPSPPLNLVLLKSCQIVGVFWGAHCEREPPAYGAEAAELLRMVETGQIRPRISAHFPLARGGDAIATLVARQALGKLVVTVP